MFNPNYQLFIIMVIANFNSVPSKNERRRRCDDDSVSSPLNFFFSSSSLPHHQPHINFWCRFGWSPSDRTSPIHDDLKNQHLIQPVISFSPASSGGEARILGHVSFPLPPSSLEWRFLNVFIFFLQDDFGNWGRSWRGASRRETCKSWMMLGARDTRWDSWTFSFSLLWPWFCKLSDLR